MLKQLLKYEFKATKSLYFGLYLALALLSVVLGVSFRQENAWADNTNFGRLEVILMVLYLSVIFAIAVLCFVSTVVVGVFDPETCGMADWDSWKQLWGMLYGELGARFWLVTFWTILINLARLADLILCVYAACMIAHPFRKYGMVSGILAFIGLNVVENQIDKLLGTNHVNLFVDITYRVADVNVTGVTYGMTPMQTMTTAFGAGSGYLFCFVVTSAFAAAYFCLTRWLMKHKLNLE